MKFTIDLVGRKGIKHLVKNKVSSKSDILFIFWFYYKLRMAKSFIFLFITTIFISQIGCKSVRGSEENEIKEFEGIIKYHEIEKGLDGALDVDDTVMVYYAHGNYAAFHSERSSKFHIVKDYYFNGAYPLRLFVDNTSDTLRSLKLDSSFGKLESFKVKKLDEKIFSRECETIEFNISFDDKEVKTYTNNIFTFSRGYLQVNKEHFKNWKLGFFNKFIDASGVYYLKLKSVHFDSSHNILGSKSYEVISVSEEKVNPKIFVIDPLKIR